MFQLRSPVQPARGSAAEPAPVQHALGADHYRALLTEAISDDHLAEIGLYLQQQHAFGRIVEAKTQHFVSVRLAHRQAG